jgi:hypothetical protein
LYCLRFCISNRKNLHPPNLHLISIDEKDWASHKHFCNIAAKKAKIASAPSSSSDINVCDEDVSQEVDDGSVAKETLSEWDADINTTNRMQLELRTLDKQYGNGFSKWWKEMTVNEKKKVLLQVTNCTIPLKTPKADEIQKKLTPGPDIIISRALFEYSVETLTNTDCVLREINDWVNYPQQKEDRNMNICSNMREIGTFPNMINGVFAYVVRPKEGDAMGGIHMVTDKAPADTIPKYKKFIEQGLMYDGSAAIYGISRKLFSLSLLIRLYDEYQVKMRRQNSPNPMERLMGCGKCRGSCQGESSKKCPTCKAVWFCCNGCMVEANHKPCPHRKEMLSVCIFR